jgi:hypothetical protein
MRVPRETGIGKVDFDHPIVVPPIPHGIDRADFHPI